MPTAVGQTGATAMAGASQNQPTTATDNPSKDNSGSQGNSKSTQRYDDNDSVVNAFSPVQLQCANGECATLTNDASVNDYPKRLAKSGMDFKTLLSQGYTNPGLNWPTESTTCKELSKRAIIVHIALWRVDSTKKAIKSLAYSTWQGYRAFWDGKQCSTKQPRSSDNSPRFFKAKQAKLIGIDLLQSEIDASSANIVYKVSTTPTIPQNIQDLGTLIEAISGATGAAGRAEAAKPPILAGFVTIADIDSTSAPPYTINVAVTAGKAGKDDAGKNTSDPPTKTASKSPTESVDCTDAGTKGCSFSRQFAVTEPESWDVAVGLAIPGVTEAVYSKSTTGSAPTSKLVHHTDAYALVDLYPFGHLAPKDSYFPHINFGIPVTSQSLHRPYFGLAEDISGWAQRKGFPLAICVFGGLVDMKQQLYSASTGALTWDRALKGVVGIEMPVGQWASKLTKSKSKSGSGSSTNSSASQ
jgi:hypothetical protein